MDYERFDLVEVVDAGDVVVELVLGGGKAIATGKPFESEIVRIRTFRGGRAVKVRSYYDTQAYAAALAPYYHSTVRGDAPAAAWRRRRSRPRPRFRSPERPQNQAQSPVGEKSQAHKWG